MERYDLYLDEQQLGAQLNRRAAIEAAERTRRQLSDAVSGRGEPAQRAPSPQVCIRITDTGEVRAVWFWTATGWRAHASEGWA